MQLLRPNRRAILGALLGIAVALAAALLGRMVGAESPVTVLLVLAIALIGLTLGAGAASYAWLASAALLLAFVVGPNGSTGTSIAESIRLAAFLIGSPFLILLVYQAEHDRQFAERARETSEEAQRQAEIRRRELVQTRVELDSALADAERDRARLEEVAEAIQEPLIVYDDRLLGTYGNRAALRLFGRSFFERPLEDWARVAEPRDERGLVLPPEEWPQVQAQRDAFRRRLTIRIPMSGRDLIVDVEGSPIPGGGCVLLLRDVSREEDERRRLSRFASFVAHELRNPLAVAKARMELAGRDPELSAKTADHARRALESVNAAISILERLELYSRADTGRIEAHRERFSLRAAAEAAIERLRARGSEREVELTMPDDLHAVGDRHLAEQAITNLLTNADRYSDPGSPVRIEASDGETVLLRVIDAGPGIDDGIADRLFRDRVAAGRGLGLGLYLVHATMRAMGGSIHLEQRRPQAVFALRWPREPSRTEESTESTDPDV
ncbi:MAG: ATP-binding protein [Candidatus Limnocylindria bacterium]